MLKDALASCGLIGILRGIRPDDAPAIAADLYDVGFRVLEIPLNSPDPLVSIRRMRSTLPSDCVVGAGTVFLPVQVEQVRRAGGELIVMPHSDRTIIEAALSAHLEVIPGVATPTEAFAAYSAGAILLKVFPAADIGPSSVRSWLSVLPTDISLIPVGGLTLCNLEDFARERIAGFGIGSALYMPSMTRHEVRQHAQDYVFAWRSIKCIREKLQ